MGFIERERARINEAIMSTRADDARYLQLLAAQQALDWAGEPAQFASPYEAVMGIRSGTETSSEGYPSS